MCGVVGVERKKMKCQQITLGQSLCLLWTQLIKSVGRKLPNFCDLRNNALIFPIQHLPESPIPFPQFSKATRTFYGCGDLLTICQEKGIMFLCCPRRQWSKWLSEKTPHHTALSRDLCTIRMSWVKLSVGQWVYPGEGQWRRLNDDQSINCQDNISGISCSFFFLCHYHPWAILGNLLAKNRKTNFVP